MIIPCCQWLASMLQTAGEQGFGVVASREFEVRRLYLQARLFSRSQQQRWAEFARDAAEHPAASRLFEGEDGGLAPLIGATWVPLRFCPQCGKDLERLIAKQAQAFDALARAHEHFVAR